MPPKLKPKDDNSGEERLTRIAVISADRCKPKKCKQECKKSCPVVKIGACGVAAPAAAPLTACALRAWRRTQRVVCMQHQRAVLVAERALLAKHREAVH